MGDSSENSEVLHKLGTKRACPECGAKFYDFNKAEFSCPKCNALMDVDTLTKPANLIARGNGKSAPSPTVDEAEEDEEILDENEDDEAFEDDGTEDDEDAVALDSDAAFADDEDEDDEGLSDDLLNDDEDDQDSFEFEEEERPSL